MDVPVSGYAVTAPFYDAIAAEQHKDVDKQIAGELDGLETAGFPVVDIGAGTGLTSLLIAGVLPKTSILAVEPDSAMRSALMTRVCSHSELRRRVSILPMELFAAPLPSVVSAFVASASLVHFEPRDRQRLLALIARRLSPIGRAILEIQCPDPLDIPETKIASTRVGSVAYEAWASAVRIDEKRQRWNMRYTARLNGAEIDRQDTDYICWAASSDMVLKEAATHGLRGFKTKNLVVLHQ